MLLAIQQAIPIVERTAEIDIGALLAIGFVLLSLFGRAIGQLITKTTAKAEQVREGQRRQPPVEPPSEDSYLGSTTDASTRTEQAHEERGRQRPDELLPEDSYIGSTADASGRAFDTEPSVARMRELVVEPPPRRAASPPPVPTAGAGGVARPPERSVSAPPPPPSRLTPAAQTVSRKRIAGLPEQVDPFASGSAPGSGESFGDAVARIGAGALGGELGDRQELTAGIPDPRAASEWRRAIVVSEILGGPVALRHGGGPTAPPGW